MRRGVDGAVPAVAGNSSGATSGKSKRSCSGSEINRLRKETLNLRGVAELSILSIWQETAAMRDVRPAYVGSGVMNVAFAISLTRLLTLQDSPQSGHSERQVRAVTSREQSQQSKFIRSPRRRGQGAWVKSLDPAPWPS